MNHPHTTADFIESIWSFPDVGPWIHHRFDTYNSIEDQIVHGLPELSIASTKPESSTK